MQENLEIIFKEDSVTIRTMDKTGSPIDIYNFQKDSLSKNESLFIDNMLSMAESMTSDKEVKRNEDCKCKNCGCKDK